MFDPITEELLVLLHYCHVSRKKALAFHHQYHANKHSSQVLDLLCSNAKLTKFNHYLHRDREVGCFIQGIEGQLSKSQIGVLNYTDSSYPQSLLATQDFPPLLFYRGNKAILNRPMIAIVGSRNASATGLRFANRIAGQLGNMGFVVCSGLAQGVDGAAHQGALDVSGCSCAVMGTGLDVIYPRGHQDLAKSLLDMGCWVSEYLPKTPPKSKNFPPRNRIISGLSLGVVIVEARERSGTLITARMALEQGREVFAVPGSIEFQGSVGCHLLIQQGAKLVINVQDIINEFEYLQLPSSNQSAIQNPDVASVVADNVILIKLGEAGPSGLTLEELHFATGVSSSQLIANVTELEIQGLVEQTPAGIKKIFK